MYIIISYITLISLALTNLMIGNIGAKNISLFLIVSAITGFEYLSSFSIKKSGKKSFGFISVILYMLLVSMVYSYSAKFTSIAYSCVFFVAFQVIMNAATKISVENTVLLFEIIIWLFFLNVIIAIFLNTSGINSEILNSIFASLYDPRVGSVRYFGFSSEPSYAAFIVIISFYVWFFLNEKLLVNKFILMFGIVIFQVFVFKSLYGYILLLSVGFLVFTRSNLKRYSWFIGILFVAIGISIGMMGNINSRALTLLNAIMDGRFNLAILNALDSSLFVRIVPMIEYIISFDLFDFHFYIGHGPGAAEIYFTNSYWSNVHKGGIMEILQLGFIPSYLYNYGLIGVCLTANAFRECCLKQSIVFPLIVMLLLSLNADFNTQLFWFTIVSFSLFDFFKLKTKQNKNYIKPDFSEKLALKSKILSTDLSFKK